MMKFFLKYMASHFEGPVREMTELWKRVRGFFLWTAMLWKNEFFGTVCLPEFILSRGLEVLKDYIQQGGNEQCCSGLFDF